jgi:transcription elongation factor
MVIVSSANESSLVIRLQKNQKIGIKNDAVGNSIVTVETVAPKEKLLVIVAYRDRAEHKKVFLAEMNEYLTRKVQSLKFNTRTIF